MRLRWESGDPGEVARRLAAVFGMAPPDAGPGPAEFRLRNAVGEVAPAGGRGAAGDLLVVLDEGPVDAVEGSIGLVEDPGAVEGRIGAIAGPGGASRDETATASATLVGIGIATVDMERFAADRGWAITRAADDDLLGARAASALMSAPASGSVHRPAILLLEPNTEGRIAASLARRGEGPAVLYLRPAAGTEDARAELSRQGCRPTPIVPGPFGPAFAIGRVTWGPHLVIVGLDVTAGPARTIAP